MMQRSAHLVSLLMAADGFVMMVICNINQEICYNVPHMAYPEEVILVFLYLGFKVFNVVDLVLLTP